MQGSADAISFPVFTTIAEVTGENLRIFTNFE